MNNHKNDVHSKNGQMDKTKEGQNNSDNKDETKKQNDSQL